MRKKEPRKKYTNLRGNQRMLLLKIIVIIAIIISVIFLYEQNRKTVVCLDAGHGGSDVRLCVKKWKTL